MPVAAPGSCSNRREVSEILLQQLYTLLGEVGSLQQFGPWPSFLLGATLMGTHCSSMWKRLLQFSVFGGLQA